ncbi:hypothetical protein AALA24_00400 [Anaerovoracaceae bacterium 42-11]
MRNFTSVFALIARLTLYKAVLAIAAITVVETGLFFYRLQTMAEPASLSEILNVIMPPALVAPMLVIFTQVLINPYNSSKGSRYLYTLRRLRVSRRKLRLIHSLFNVLCYILFIAVQIFAAWIFCRIYMERLPFPNSQQTIFMAFHGSGFLSIIFPYGRPLQFLVNALFLFLLSWLQVPTTHIKGDDYDETIQQNEEIRSLPA